MENGKRSILLAPLPQWNGLMPKTYSASLKEAFPEIASEWHSFKNGLADPDKVASKSTKKYWWKCKKNPSHEWESRVQDRTLNKAGCPYCSHKYVSDETRLSILYPHIAAEWHPTKNRLFYSRIEGWEGSKNRQFPEHGLPKKNRRLLPSDLSYASNEMITWQCKKNPEHIWEAKVHSRTIGERGCPYCSGNKVGADNNLLTVNPQIAKQWHPTRNKPFTPKDITSGSNRLFWWRCFKFADHIWQAKVNSILRSRKLGKSGCPFCAGVKVSKDNCLQKKYPEVAKLWHKELNGDIKPQEVTARSSKKFFWQCPKSSEHNWKASVSNMILVASRGNSGCPYCSGKRVSDEKSLVALYPQVAERFHKELNFPLTAEGVTAGSGRVVFWHCLENSAHAFQYKVQAMVANFQRGNNAICPQCRQEESLGQAYPEVALLFHPERNHPLIINHVHPGSHKKVWWQCPYERSHVWEQAVRKRVSSWRLGINCPICKR